MRATRRAIVVGTLISGTLDILMATVITLLRGRHPADMLRFVASGPIPAAQDWGAAGAMLGLAVHFTLMAIMVSAFVLLASRYRAILDRWAIWGAAYGVLTYAVLDLLVVPLRFPAAWPPTFLSISTQLFAHVVLVGLVTGFIARRHLRPSAD